MTDNRQNLEAFVSVVNTSIDAYAPFAKIEKPVLGQPRVKYAVAEAARKAAARDALEEICVVGLDVLSTPGGMRGRTVRLSDHASEHPRQWIEALADCRMEAAQRNLSQAETASVYIEILFPPTGIGLVGPACRIDELDDFDQRELALSFADLTTTR